MSSGSYHNYEQECRTDTFFIRPVIEADEELYRKVAVASFDFDRLYLQKKEDGIDLFWYCVMKSTGKVTYSVFLHDGTFIGKLALQDIDKDIPELAITIIKERQRQGYGKKLLFEWLKWLSRTYGLAEIRVNIEQKNDISKNFFKQLGYEEEYSDEMTVYGFLRIPLQSRQNL